jgi:hypothetical protein
MNTALAPMLCPHETSIRLTVERRQAALSAANSAAQRVVCPYTKANGKCRKSWPVRAGVADTSSSDSTYARLVAKGSPAP